MFEDKFSWITIHGVKTWMRYIETDNDRGDKSLVIFIPGLGGWAEIYEDILKEIQNYAYHGVAVDHLGFGKSGKPNVPYSLEMWAAAIIKWINKQNYNDFHLVGHSMAGSVLMKIWRLTHNKIKSLTLISPAGFGKELHIGYRIGSLRIINGLVSEVFLNSWNPIYRKPNPNFWRASYYDINKVPQKVMRSTIMYNKNPRIKQIYFQTVPFYASLKGQKEEVVKENLLLLEKMREMVFPLHVIWGANDQIIPAKHVFNILKHYPKAKISIINKSGHTPYVEQPQEFIKKLVGFLQQIDKLRKIKKY